MEPLDEENELKEQNIFQELISYGIVLKGLIEGGSVDKQMVDS